MGLQNRIKPKRSLGQNFFINRSLAKYIADIVLESSPISITEIGPGGGVFTKEFYDTTKKIVLIEKDDSLIIALQRDFPNATIMHSDFLDIELSDMQTTYFGSLPYNVSKPIIKKILTSETFTNPAFFIIQKEVAEKYTNKETNALGLIREIYADCKILFNIKPDSFSPRPKVMSSFIKFSSNNKYKDVNRNELESLILSSFKHPRKTLRNNLKNTRYKILTNEEILRPDQLNLDQYISILNRS